MRQRGLTHLYIGRGKGKTTAALGLLLRACGAKKMTCLIQFLKAKPSSEISILKKLKITVISFREKHPLFYKSASIEKLKKKVSEDLKETKTILKSKRYNFIVLDELLYLLEKKLTKECEILKLIKSKPAQTELILTGGSASKAILKLADYVSIIKDTKHPFKKGISARMGIEF